MVVEAQTMTVVIGDKVSTSNLSKQVLVSATTGLLCMCGGFTYGYSAVLIPRVKDDPKFPYDGEYDSWVASIAPLSMAFGSLFSGILSDKLGRKYTHILLMWPFLIGFLVLAFSTSVTYLLLGRALTGMCTGVFRSIGAVYLVEVSDPKNRALLQFTLSLAATIGILASHIIGGFLSIRHSCLIFCSPIFIAFIFLIFLKESPLWLISKGRLEEGIECFEWYRTKSEASQKELAEVLEKQKEKTVNLTATEILRTIFSKSFLKAYCTGFFLFATAQFCGLNNLIFYAQDLLRPTFSDKINAFLLMIIVDVLRIIGNIVLFPVLKYCPRRKSFFVFACIVISLLIGNIIYIIVEPVGLTWLLLICLIIFTVIGGIMISLAWTFVAEIFPNKIRGIGSGMSATTSFLLLFVSIKLTPEIMESFGVIALYSSFAATTFVSLIALSFLLPDTDGKTLLEIENGYKNKQ